MTLESLGPLWWIPFTRQTCDYIIVQPFGSVLNLIPLAESVVKLKAVCMVCFKDAAFTKRLGTEQEASD